MSGAAHRGMRTTIGELITGLVEAYERQYEDHELATVKTALVVDGLLRVCARRAEASTAVVANDAQRSTRTARRGARKAA
jgi:hypothetical protein